MQSAGLEISQLSPLLNVGSATAEFRQQAQPWIDQLIFGPLRQRHVEVCHLDMFDGQGVDLCGDLNDERFIAGLFHHGYRTVLCCNLLEHVADPAAICGKLEHLLPEGGHIIASVPYRFPYHPDPIDTMFRPTPQELINLFPRCRPVHGMILDCGTGWDYVERDWRVLILKVQQRLAGTRRHGGVKGSTSFLPWLLRRFRQTCVVLERRTGPAS